ncbi:unnamed protein product, partial [Amoebophrya sp. A25]|eukprot:GSA25T00025126001.1
MFGLILGSKQEGKGGKAGRLTSKEEMSRAAAPSASATPRDHAGSSSVFPFAPPAGGVMTPRLGGSTAASEIDTPRTARPGPGEVIYCFRCKHIINTDEVEHIVHENGHYFHRGCF